MLLAGGVAANELLRAEMVRNSPVPVRCPPLELCTDNAAIVATAGFFRFQAGERSGWDLDVVPGLRLATSRRAGQFRTPSQPLRFDKSRQSG